MLSIMGGSSSKPAAAPAVPVQTISAVRCGGCLQQSQLRCFDANPPWVSCFPFPDVCSCFTHHAVLGVTSREPRLLPRLDLPKPAPPLHQQRPLQPTTPWWKRLFRARSLTRYGLHTCMHA